MTITHLSRHSLSPLQHRRRPLKHQNRPLLTPEAINYRTNYITLLILMAVTTLAIIQPFGVKSDRS